MAEPVRKKKKGTNEWEDEEKDDFEDEEDWDDESDFEEEGSSEA